MKHSNSEKLVKAIHPKTCRKYSAQEKIRIVLEGLRDEESIAELCRREGLNQNVYYRWSQEFLEAGKQRLSGNTKREATSADMYYGRYHQIMDQRAMIKQQTLQLRRCENLTSYTGN